MSTADGALKAAGSSGLRRLLTRKLPTHTHYLRAVPPEETEEARRAVKLAREKVELASIRMDDDGPAAREAAEAVLEAAQERLAACYEPVVVQALDEPVYEELATKHKDETADAGVDQASLGRDAFLAGVQGDLTAEEWDSVLAQCSHAERAALYVTALSVNVRTTDGSIPKG